MPEWFHQLFAWFFFSDGYSLGAVFGATVLGSAIGATLERRKQQRIQAIKNAQYVKALHERGKR